LRRSALVGPRIDLRQQIGLDLCGREGRPSSTALEFGQIVARELS
jgi:hypothetical protein